MCANDDEIRDSSDLLGVVMAVVSEVFERPVARTDNFFDLGGDSLCAVQLRKLLEERLGAELDMETLIDAEDMGALADAVAVLIGQSKNSS